MGYAHNYEIIGDAPRRTAEIAQDAKRLISHAKDTRGVTVVDGAGSTGSNPTVTDELIRFGGPRPYHSQAFTYPPEAAPFDDGSGFGSCKTRHWPYDIVVCAVLCAVKHHLGEAVVISSDGSPFSDWETGKPLWDAAGDLYVEAFPDRPHPRDTALFWEPPGWV